MEKHLVRIDYGEEHWEDFAQMNRWIYLCYAGDHTETDLYNIHQEYWEIAPVLLLDTRINSEEIWSYSVTDNIWRQMET
mgnify:CR=1 FL=1